MRPKMRLATRNPVFCEFMFLFSASIFVLSVKMHGGTASVYHAVVSRLRDEGGCRPSKCGRDGARPSKLGWAAPAQGRRLNENSDRCQTDKQNGRSRWRQHNGVLNQMRAD